MALPVLTPASNSSKSILSVTGSTNDVVTNLPYGIYAANANFISGAADQVSYTYKKFGGDVLDIELHDGQVYAAYEESVLEYSYIVNIHQAKNVLSNLLGNTTSSFNHDGSIASGSALYGENVALKFPKFDYAYARKTGETVSADAGIGGSKEIYSASFAITNGQQLYDLQSIVASASTTGLDNGTGNAALYANLVGSKKILIREVYYRTPASMWRFFGYYGGINVIGNLSTYGQWADDSTFQVVPVWQNKAQAMAFEDALYTRLSHYSYDIVNNKLRLFPVPHEGAAPTKFWIRFTIPSDAWTEESNKVTGVNGINNMNTLPFENLPYDNINSIGKHWIRRYALSVSKEMLGLNRGKFSQVPIPGESVTLNHDALLGAAKEEKEKLREELKETLDQLIYSKLVETDATLLDNAKKINQNIPMPILRG